MAADLSAFDSAGLFQVHGNSGDQGQLSEINLADNSFTDLGENSGYKINAAGYRVEDNFIYAIKSTTDELLRIDAQGTHQNLGSIQGLPNRSYYSADFGPDGLLYFWSGQDLFGVNVDTVEVERHVELSRSMGSTPDIAFDPETELMYGIEKNSNRKLSFVSIDVKSGSVTTINDDFQPNDSIYGAMFADSTGRVFAAANLGGLYEIDKLTGEAKFVAHTPRASSNDGAAPSNVVFNLPPVMENSWNAVREGAKDFELNLPMPSDAEGDEIKIVLKEVPATGQLKLADGTPLKAGDSLSEKDVAGLLYDAPEKSDAKEPASSQIVFLLSDGNSESLAKAEIQVNGNSRLAGKVQVLYDNDNDAFDAFAFNNVITLKGKTFDGIEVVETTRTDVYGNYEFLDVAAGSYSISQDQPATVFDSTPTVGELGGKLGTNVIADIQVPEGPSDSYEGYDFLELAPSKVAGFVFLDGNANGELDSIERGLRTVTVHLTGKDDRGFPVSATTVTGAAGLFEFTRLRPGNYTVTQVQPDELLSRVSLVGSEGGAASLNKISSLSVGAGISATHYDFGELEKGSLTGHVYVDNDFDKVFDRGDTPMEDVTVALVGVDYTGAVVEQKTTTDSEGMYVFDSLLPGKYSLIESQPDVVGVIDSRENLGLFSGNPQVIERNGIAGEDRFTQIQLQQGEVGQNYDFTETVVYQFAGEGEDVDEIVQILGTEGDDKFEFIPGEKQHEIRLNGESKFLDATNSYAVVFVGLAGNDYAHITGTSGVEQLTMKPGEARMVSNGFVVKVFETENIDADHGGGYDRAFMYDSEGDDRLKATESYVRVWGEDYQNQANGYHRTYTYASEGHDRAYFHDSKKDDTYRASETLARMFSAKYYNLAEGFDRTYAYAESGGEDTATLWDSAQDGDVFESHPRNARMYNDNYYNSAEGGFEVITAHATEGGSDDRAYLYDSAGDEILISTPAESALVGDDVKISVDSFERVYAFASEGEDTAYIYDSLNDDKFLSYPDHVRMYNDDYFLKASGFDQVDAYSSGGGNDRAYFFDSEGDDTLIALENEVRMFGTGYDTTSHDFLRAYAWSENGGLDTAYLYDSESADTLKTEGDNTRMYGIDYYTSVTGFGSVDIQFNDFSNQDRAFLFGQISEDTANNVGEFGDIMYEHGSLYIENADAVFSGVGDNESDDDGLRSSSDDFDFVPGKIGSTATGA